MKQYLYGYPQHDLQRDDDERSVYGSPQHEVTDAKTSGSTDSDPRLRARLFP
ncbi:hypothetical protein [Haladaptatus sp. R4]|uniref:hypothetical protein n=1 Tax=Haladaptatus sp. R4 TaxID=1679489 RepID=UPI000ADFA792|nr:hypothetical protein [Haladaptatus sp. R4]